MSDRANQLIADILRRVHEAIVENDITYEEYHAAKQWFIDVGEHGEWPLFGDVFIEHVVEEQAFGNRKGSPGTILGPFHVPDAPLLGGPFELPHRPDEPGDRTHISGRVTDVDGNPLAEANLDIWQADSEGRYSGSCPVRLRATCAARCAPTAAVATSTSPSSQGRTRSRSTARRAGWPQPPAGARGARRTST